MRRSDKGGWTQVATFGTHNDAAEFVDGEVGQRHGTLHDYEISPLAAPDSKWRVWGTRALILLAVAGALGLLILFIGPGR
ncbi:MAG: hypothetical protein WD757_06065 [Actinomycetota bacterium]